jgi:hypothetical protein
MTSGLRPQITTLLASFVVRLPCRQTLRPARDRTQVLHTESASITRLNWNVQGRARITGTDAAVVGGPQPASETRAMVATSRVRFADLKGPQLSSLPTATSRNRWKLQNMARTYTRALDRVGVLGSDRDGHTGCVLFIAPPSAVEH